MVAALNISDIASDLHNLQNIAVACFRGKNALASAVSHEAAGFGTVGDDGDERAAHDLICGGMISEFRRKKLCLLAGRKDNTVIGIHNSSLSVRIGTQNDSPPSGGDGCRLLIEWGFQTGAAGLPDDQTGLMGNGDAFGVVVDCTDQCHDRHTAQITVLLIQSRKAGAGIIAGRKLVTADDRNIFGNAQAGIGNGSNGSLGHGVVDADHGGGERALLFQQPLHGLIAVWRIIIA